MQEHSCFASVDGADEVFGALVVLVFGGFVLSTVAKMVINFVMAGTMNFAVSIKNQSVNF